MNRTEHLAFHERSSLPLPSPPCTTCETLQQEAITWAYGLGLPRFEARAFARWWAEHAHRWVDMPSGLTQARYDKRFHELYREEGSTPDGT
jgi:hypothetical protein